MIGEKISIWSKIVVPYKIVPTVFSIFVLSCILHAYFPSLNLIERSGSVITLGGLLLTNRDILRNNPNNGAYASEFDGDIKYAPLGVWLIVFGTIIWGYGGLLTKLFCK